MQENEKNCITFLSFYPAILSQIRSMRHTGLLEIGDALLQNIKTLAVKLCSSVIFHISISDQVLPRKGLNMTDTGTVYLFTVYYLFISPTS